MRRPLGIIPTYLRAPADLDLALRTISACYETDPEVDLLVVDDGSPASALVDALDTHRSKLPFDLHRKQENGGFSRTVNVGLAKACAEGRDAVLINADLEPQTKQWGRAFANVKDSQGRPAAVVGALLLYPSGLIQHAGVYFSYLTRSPDHRFRFAPQALPEAHYRKCCIVTGAFQYIRHSTLERVGLYDETFRLGFEDVSYCIDTFEAGLECWYEPTIRAVHHESVFRGQGRGNPTIDQWHRESSQRLMTKHTKSDLSRYIPQIL